MFVAKKYVAPQFCVAYFQFNVVSQPRTYQISRKDECSASHEKATVFSTLDANSGYWKIEIDDADKDKTEFLFHPDFYCFIWIFFKFHNAFGTFQRTVDMILSSVKWQLALVCIDGLVFFSKTPQQHINHVRKILSLLKAQAPHSI